MPEDTTTVEPKPETKPEKPAPVAKDLYGPTRVEHKKPAAKRLAGGDK